MSSQHNQKGNKYKSKHGLTDRPDEFMVCHSVLFEKFSSRIYLLVSKNSIQYNLKLLFGLITYNLWLNKCDVTKVRVVPMGNTMFRHVPFCHMPVRHGRFTIWPVCHRLGYVTNSYGEPAHMAKWLANWRRSRTDYGEPAYGKSTMANWKMAKWHHILP